MTYSSMRVGTRLSMTLYDEDGNPSRTGLVSQFESADEDDVLHVLAPMKGGLYVPILPNDILDVEFDCDGSAFTFRAIARELVREGRVRLLNLLPETEITVIQRRGYYRFPHVTECSYRILKEPIPPEAERGPFRTTSTRNLSGGGIGLLFEDKPEMGMNIEGNLNLAGGIRFIGAIVRIEPNVPGSAYRYEVGVSFLKIENRTRERLIAYIFEAQRNLLKKGWTGA